MFRCETMSRMYVFLFPMLPGEYFDARRTLGYLFHSRGINNARRQAFTGFWFAISKGRKCAAYSLSRAVELHFHEMSRDDSFFSLTCYFECVMCIFQHQRSPLGWKPAWGWEPNKKFFFLFCQVMDSFTWGKMKYFKGKGHPLSASPTDSSRSTSRVIADNLYSKETVPLAAHSKTRDAVPLSCNTQTHPSLTLAGLMKDPSSVERSDE